MAWKIDWDGSSSMPQRNANLPVFKFSQLRYLLNHIGSERRARCFWKNKGQLLLFEQTVMWAFSRDTLLEEARTLKYWINQKRVRALTDRKLCPCTVETETRKIGSSRFGYFVTHYRTTRGLSEEVNCRQYGIMWGFASGVMCQLVRDVESMEQVDKK